VATGRWIKAEQAYMDRLLDKASLN
jgi:hypothetical protein